MYKFPPWRHYHAGEYEVAILEGASGLNVLDDNVDVEVRYPNGDRYGATFFTLQNIHMLMANWAASVECSGGLYFSAQHAIVVREITIEVILAVVADLHFSGQLAKYCERLEP